LKNLETGDSIFARMGGAMAAQKLTDEIIHAAIDGFEFQKKKIDAQIAELRQMLTGAAPEAPASPGASIATAPKKKRRMSAAGRRAIAEGQRKRWATAKGQSAPAKKEAPKVKRKISAAGRKAIADATRKRWALVRAQKAAAAKA
jgi:hypothetical protein